MVCQTQIVDSTSQVHPLNSNVEMCELCDTIGIQVCAHGDEFLLGDFAGKMVNIVVNHG